MRLLWASLNNNFSLLFPFNRLDITSRDAKFCKQKQMAPSSWAPISLLFFLSIASVSVSRKHLQNVCHVGGRQCDYNENNIPCLTRSTDAFAERLHCGWCATNVPAVSCCWLVPIRDLPGAQSSSLAFWNSKTKVITHHLPPSATKTREHAVQASCWICMCDPFWRIIPSFSIGRTFPHTSLQWLTSPCPCALKWAFPSCCHGKIGSSVKKK